MLVSDYVSYVSKPSPKVIHIQGKNLHILLENLHLHTKTHMASVQPSSVETRNSVPIALSSDPKL